MRLTSSKRARKISSKGNGETSLTSNHDTTYSPLVPLPITNLLISQVQITLTLTEIIDLAPRLVVRGLGPLEFHRDIIGDVIKPGARFSKIKTVVSKLLAIAVFSYKSKDVQRIIFFVQTLCSLFYFTSTTSYIDCAFLLYFFLPVRDLFYYIATCSFLSNSSISSGGSNSMGT